MTEKLWEQFDLSKTEQIVKELLDVPGISFQSMVENLMAGNMDEALRQIWLCLCDFAFPGIWQCKRMFITLFMVVLATVFVHYLSMVLKTTQVTKMAYDILYLLVMLILLYIFDGIYETGQETMVQVKDFMTVLIPSYCLSMALSQSTLLASANYEFLLMLLIGVDYIMLRLFLPLTKSCFFIALINGLDERGRLRELWKFLMKIITWGMKLCLSLTIAVSGLGNLVTGANAGVQKTLVRKVIGVIPGIGDLGDSVTEVFLTSASLIRNCIGVAAIIILFLIIFRPATTTFGIYFGMKLTAVCSSLLGQDRMAKSLSDASQCSMQILKMHLCCVMLFSIVLAVTMQLNV